MRMIGPALEPTRPTLDGYDVFLIRCITYMIIATKNTMRMIQQTTYPAVVVVSDARLRMVIINTISAMMNKKINSYMFDLLISIENSF